MFWGALDLEQEYAANPAYLTTEYVSLGESARPGEGIGVRRATLHLKRTASGSQDDDAQVHFDFLNITSDAPDDTWTSGDFSALEGRLTTWWAAVKGQVPTWYSHYRFSWHRVGSGIVKPNPAARITDLVTPVAGTATSNMPPQVACSISLRTAIRKHWGRTYLPFGNNMDSFGRVPTANAGVITAATKALLDGAKSDDFVCVVTSETAQSAFVVDQVSVDDVADIIRRRRWKRVNSRSLVTIA